MFVTTAMKQQLENVNLIKNEIFNGIMGKTDFRKNLFETACPVKDTT